jgi:AcrR family transcriptional regulator
MAVKRPPAPARARPTGRPAQRRRTRKAIVDATMGLVASGRTPSVADVAEAADVSRRTIYLYFPRFDQLLIDATIGVLSEAQVGRAIQSDEGGVEARVERLVRAMNHVSPEVERLGRALIRLTVEAGDAAPDGGVPRRGYRRVEWIERALAPLRDRVDARRFRRLVMALAMIVGWEALIVQRDVCGLGASEGEELSVWAARSFLRTTLQDLRTDRQPGRRRSRPRNR